MKLNNKYINIRDKWWALPLILPSVLLPFFGFANTYAHTCTGSGNVALLYLPLALMVSLMSFFDWAALPGIAVAIFWHRYPLVGLSETLFNLAHFIIPVVLCWGGYRIFVPRRNQISHGDVRLTC